MTENNGACPCGSGKSYGQCCRRWHAGAPAPTAEQLMRSRYCAYVLKLEPYLRETWAAETRPATLGLHGDAIKWLGLKVVAAGAINAASRENDTAFVEFIARFKQGGGAAQRLHERSRFVRREGRWYYADGQFLE